MDTSVDKYLHQLYRNDEEAQTKRLAAQYSLGYINLIGYPIVPQTLTLVTSAEAQQYRVIPYLKAEGRLLIAVNRPSGEQEKFLTALATRVNLDLHISLCSDASYEHGIRLIGLIEAKRGKQLQVAVSQQEQQAALAAIKGVDELKRRLATASTTDTLDVLFGAATGMEASDIHIEPTDTAIRVRFRIDGVLQEIVTLPIAAHKTIVSRVKYLARLKLDVTKAPQDGRFTITLAGGELDVRVSTLPSAYGEIIDMRLLRAHAQFIKLADLGFRPEALAKIKAAVSKPHGMILVTGPTGSGKTTTLYAILDHLNRPEIKIIALEDPIEYRLDGIDQVQVDEAHGLSFADALRGSLRQDPDILMVGEIRDKETAEIGLQAAMTGHLFLSTLHTNNAPSSLARLVDMGVEPYRIAGAINIIVAQRLVRKLCANCHGAGCDICHQTGFKGRLPILEVLEPSEELDAAIMRRASVRDLYDIAVKNGLYTMEQDGMDKVSQGLTTKEEVERVAQA